MKKTLFYLVIFSFLASCKAQDSFYSKRGIVIEGYDVTEYFNKKAIKGSADFSTTYQKAVFHFKNEANKVKFEKNPKAYLPEYGGYCAYAIGKKSEKVKIDPETFSLENGKVYLFYNSWGTNTLNLWNKEGAEALRIKADENWNHLKSH